MSTAYHSRSKSRLRFNAVKARLKLLNGLLWLILGLAIVLWLVLPNDILLTSIWVGFAIGCMLTGLFMVDEVLESQPQDPFRPN